jgi:quinol monooxygenase YgiN
MDALSGCPHIDTDQQAENLATLRTASDGKRADTGSVERWSCGDLDQLRRFRCFEIWESEEALGAHRTQPHEQQSTADHVARITGADARHTIPAGRSVMGR